MGREQSQESINKNMQCSGKKNEKTEYAMQRQEK